MAGIRALIDGTVAGTRRLIALYDPRTMRQRGWLWTSGVLGATLVVAMLVLSSYWSREPDPLAVRELPQRYLAAGLEPVTGSYTTATLIGLVETLLDKPGGYLSNDVMPPSVWMDNMPNWEFGVLVQARDLARALRNDMSRSQSQSVENRDLAVAEPQLNFNSDSWIFPATEGEYRKAVKALRNYLNDLSRDSSQRTQFYARADNLRDWLAIVEKRLGSLSQRLSASVGQERLNTDLAGDPDAAQSTRVPEQMAVKTPWLEIDDVFYEARGTTWALVQILHAIEIDFARVLNKKNALVSLRQIVRELEAAQQPVFSPVVLNGRGFGLVTNYSLVMSSYISRANAALIDLRDLLQQG
ncbi:MAG TPA: DUF2333 family protein [Sedimenticola thiotaurini]|uniref:DUF2333 family protein n=1 Tax=Sedimenticola thiotaurini TaxID=1543721 RepID=A0A831RKU3_9GAMM|nr:DUF2333 family protein [Sedimenticola thiotaurini]